MRVGALILTIIYTIAGIAACIAFLILKFYISAVLGIFTAIISFATVHLLILEGNGGLQTWYAARELKQLCWLGFWLFTSGCVTLVYFTVYLFLENKFEMIKFTAIIWSFITAKSALLLMYYTNKFRELQAGERLTSTEE
ncbi:PREDICTED: uncharacterized protein LOC108556989 [Nicrophorus vespilloides]|uniref:Uncharacterized protein LOC108556989 n=1 Tax=Nicrophorus vespilloides TaxID=110193 RepID=A0ABM1M2P0_NICVS|nr:PREDICTED: uncharacterized protein LOC108556989 [Nicrophorus vespilloides]